MGLQWKQQLRSLLDRHRFEKELQEEIDFHLEMQERANREAGMPAAEAARQARLDFGNVALVREDSRAPWLRSRIDELQTDLRYALRWLVHHPVFSAAVVTTLALGIGANSAVFSLLDALLLQVPAVEHPEDVVFIGDSGGSGVFQGVHTRHTTLLSMPMARALEERQARFDSMASLSSYTTPLYLSRGGELERLEARLVSGGFFRVLGVGAARGRVLEPNDDKPESVPALVLSHAAWQRHFGGRAEIVGQTVKANGLSFVVVGVAAPGFHGLIHGRDTEAWIPEAHHAQVLRTEPRTERSDLAWLRVFARKSPGTEQEEAAEHLTDLFRAQALEEWGGVVPQGTELSELRLSLRSLADGPSTIRGAYARPVTLLMAVVAIVLMIACANVANLLLARASSRRHELATRVALGASRSRLMRQLLTEGALLAFLGGGLGLVVASLGVHALLVMFAEDRADAFLDASLDLRVVVFTVLLSLVTVLLSGLAPARSGARLVSMSKERNGSSASGRPSLRRLGSWLVIAQVALSLVLLVAAGLFLRTLENLHAVDSGMATDSILLLQIDPAGAGIEGEARQELYRNLVASAESLPGIQAASVSTFGLFTGDKWLTRAFPQGIELEDSERVVQADLIGGHHFEALGVPLLEGRRFTQADRGDSAPVAIVNRTYSERFFPEVGALGSRLGFGGEENSGEIEVVGIVADTKYHDLREDTPARVYLPVAQEDDFLECLTVRADGDPTRVAAALRAELRRVSPLLPVLDLRTLPQQIDRSLARERLIGRLSLLFSGIALLLAALGLYAVLAYSVAGRVRELGVRIAIGARRREILMLVLRDAMTLVAVGTLLGVPAALVLGAFARSLLFGLSPSDPITLTVAVLVVLMAAFLSSYLPARRAARLDPVDALRAE